MALLKKPLLAHPYSGKLAAHEHTSYAGLLFMMLLTGVVVAAMATQTLADDVYSEPSGYTIYGVIEQPPPTTPAQILHPTSGQRFSATPITVDGTCPQGTLVAIYKNEVMAGTTLCQQGKFSLNVDLFAGRNDLIARVYNGLNAAGPDSTTVTVFYDRPVGSGEAPVVTSEVLYKGYYTGSEISWQLTVTRGKQPYAIQVDWGDGSIEPSVLGQAGKLTIKHTYAQAAESGSYSIKIKAVDSLGNVGFLQLAGIVRDVKAAAPTTSKPGGFTTNLQLAWPLWVLFLGMLLAFWLGEWVQKKHDSLHPPVPA